MAVPAYLWSSLYGSFTTTDNAPVAGGACGTNRIHFSIEGYPIDNSFPNGLRGAVSGLSSPARITSAGTSVNMKNTLPFSPSNFDPLGFTFDLDSIGYACIDGVEYSSEKQFGHFWVPDQKPVISRRCDGSCKFDLVIPAAYWVKRVRLQVVYANFSEYVYDSGELLAFKPGSDTVLLFPEVSVGDLSVDFIPEYQDLYISVIQYIDTNPNSVVGTTRIVTTRTLYGISYACSCGTSKRRCQTKIVQSRRRGVVPVPCDEEVQPPAPPPPTTEIPPYDTSYYPSYEASFNDAYAPAPWEFGSEHDHTTVSTNTDDDLPGMDKHLEASTTNYLFYDEVFILPSNSKFSLSMLHRTDFGETTTAALTNEAHVEVSSDLSEWSVLHTFTPTVQNLGDTWNDVEFYTESDIEMRYARLVTRLKADGFIAPPASPGVSVTAKIGDFRIIPA